MRILQGVFLSCLFVLLVFGACRRNQPSLVDTNQPPNTELWYAPPDSTDYEYLVHLYWRGLDNDGTAVKYIWTVRDTLVAGELVWDPASRLRDYREGRITARTDSVFSFKAFKNVGGVGVKKNRQAFHIAAIDDNGVIDPTPAAVEFVATIAEFPSIRFITYIEGRKPYEEIYVHRAVPKDTVGYLHPFQISYRGQTKNGLVRAYRFFSLTSGVPLKGDNVWHTIHPDSLVDTLRTFTNTGKLALPPGVFKFAAQCLDDAQAESPIDAGTFARGVCQVVVNFDPDTQFNGMESSYALAGVNYRRGIDFTDGVPDTVPFDSWLRIDYSGWDDTRDVKSDTCNPLTNPRKCIKFQVQYISDSERIQGAGEQSGWLPRGSYHDTDPNSATDSNTFHIGSLEYKLMVRAVDEHLKADGTPPSVEIVGNFDPTLDSLFVEDHFGNRVNISDPHAELVWNFWKGEGWPYRSGCDTIDRPRELCPGNPDNTGTNDFYKKFSFRIKGWGHDHPMDPTGSAIWSWQYLIRNSQGNIVNLGKSTSGFFEGLTQNTLNDKVQWRVLYPRPSDPMGDTVFQNLPSWMNQDLTFFVIGRDTKKTAPDFVQSVFLNGEKTIINEFPYTLTGRYTRERVFTFKIRLIRP
jgi:hypothetical protein